MIKQHINKYFKYLVLACATVSISGIASANDFMNSPAYSSFKQKMATSYGFSSEQVDAAMTGTQRLPKVLEIMARPGESKPWYAYQEMFLQTGTIQRGIRFKNQYAEVLQRAENQFGVPQAIILGILGVETGYGANKGNFKTRDTLATLAFDSARRADYFADELAAFLTWTTKEGYASDSIVGSYAGALGYPQFMPSNISKYAVDYDGNGHIDLNQSAIDAIGSVANYLAQHGWQRNQPIGIAARYIGSTPEQIIAADLTQPQPYGVLKNQGISPIDPIVKIDDMDLVNVIQLQEKYGPSYYITYPNFQVITTYNKSRMYATAVWKLGTEIMNN